MQFPLPYEILFFFFNGPIRWPFTICNFIVLTIFFFTKWHKNLMGFLSQTFEFSTFFFFFFNYLDIVAKCLEMIKIHIQT